MLFTKNKCRFLGMLVICSLILCSCGEIPSSVTDYSITSVSEDTAVTGGDSSSALPLLSNNLCVIPKKTKFKKDSAMRTSVSSLLINDTENKAIYGDSIYKKMYPASITKIVTALVALKYGNLDDTVTFSYDASHITEWGATLCGFEEGDQINMLDLLTAFLMYSGNDAGVAIAEHIGGSVEGFAKMMNDEMRELGASRSHFVNPHGLHDDDHYTCAYDLYLVFHELTNYETFLNIIHDKSIKIKYKNAKGKKKKIKFEASNRYINGRMQPPQGITVVGGKTGTTSKAGSCLILYSTGDNNDHYISVILHADSAEDLFAEMNHLLELAAKEK